MNIALIAVIIALVLAILAAAGVPRWDKLLSTAVIIVCIVLLISKI
jgi:hypothetical protein